MLWGRQVALTAKHREQQDHRHWSGPEELARISDEEWADEVEAAGPASSMSLRQMTAAKRYETASSTAGTRSPTWHALVATGGPSSTVLVG